MGKRFASTRLRAATLATTVLAVAASTLGLGMSQAAHAETWCGNLAQGNDMARCVDSLSQAGSYTRPVKTGDLHDETFAIHDCLLSSNATCDSRGRDSHGHLMHWEIKKITWIHPQVSTYTDWSAVSHTASIYACSVNASRSVSTSYTKGHGPEFESFGFLPDAGVDREGGHGSNWLSKTFGASLGLLGDLTWSAGVPDSWQVGETQTAFANAGSKAWIDLSPSFVTMKGKAVLHMQYKWTDSLVYHHRDLLVDNVQLKVPHTVNYNGGKIQSATSAAKGALQTRQEWDQYCHGQFPSPYHFIKTWIWSNVHSVRLTNNQNFNQCTNASKQNDWLDTGRSMYRGEYVQVTRYSGSNCGGAVVSRQDLHAPALDGLKYWYV